MRAAAEKERIEQGLISISEILAYLQTDRYLDLKEAAQYLPFSYRTIWGHRNEIPHFKYGNKIIFRKS